MARRQCRFLGFRGFSFGPKGRNAGPQNDAGAAESVRKLLRNLFGNLGRSKINFRNAVAKAVIYDGAVGTNILTRNPTLDDYWGKENCTAEALAEYLHKKMREELGIAGEDSPHIRDLFHQKYQGSRYSFGYPACPNLEDQTKLFALLHPEENVGVKLTTGFLLEPEQSTSAIVVHHPQAKYFVV
jgi:hypothetical protein